MNYHQDHQPNPFSSAQSLSQLNSPHVPSALYSGHHADEQGTGFPWETFRSRGVNKLTNKKKNKKHNKAENMQKLNRRMLQRRGPHFLQVIRGKAAQWWGMTHTGVGSGLHRGEIHFCIEHIKKQSPGEPRAPCYLVWDSFQGEGTQLLFCRHTTHRSGGIKSFFCNRPRLLQLPPRGSRWWCITLPMIQFISAQDLSATQMGLTFWASV